MFIVICSLIDILAGMNWNLKVLIGISGMNRDVGLLKNIYQLLVFSCELFSSLIHSLIKMFLIFKICSALHILDINPCLKYSYEGFSPNCRLAVHSDDSYFGCAEPSNFM